MLKHFIVFEYSKIKKYYRTRTLAKIIVTSLFFVLFSIIGVGMFHFFTSSFLYIQKEADAGIQNALLLFLCELFCGALAGIAFLSTCITSLFGLFRTSHNSWILASPSYQKFPYTVYIKGLYSSTLILVFMFLPALFALISVYHSPWYMVFVLLFSVILISVIINTFAITSLLILARLYMFVSEKYNKIPFTFNGLVLCLSLIIFTSIFYLWQTIKNADLLQIFKNNTNDPLFAIHKVAESFVVLPTHPLAMEIIYFQIGDTIEIVRYFSIVTMSTLFLFGVWIYVARMFYPLWLRLASTSFVVVDTKKPKSTKKYSICSFRGSTTNVLFTKEILLYARNSKSILWFLFLCALWFVQLATNILFNHKVLQYGDDIHSKIIVLEVLQFGIALYFINALTLRFVFPSFSTERRTAWILGSAPVSLSTIFFSKYFFYTSFFILLSVVMNYCNSYALHLSLHNTIISILLGAFVTLFIVTIGLTIGALFPNTETDDPDSISTSMPGLGFTAVSLIYSGVSSVVLYFLLTMKTFYYVYIFCGISTLCILILVRKMMSKNYSK